MDDMEIAGVDENGDVIPEADGRWQSSSSPLGFMAAGELARTHGGQLLLLLLAVLCALLLFLAKKRRGTSHAATPQDSEAVVRRQEAMEASRRKMQQEQDAKAAIFREKRKQQEEEKRRQKIDEWDSMQLGKSFKGASRRLQSDRDQGASSGAVIKPKSDKKPLRSSDYNPLSGEGSGSCSWRPGRRGPSSPGG